MAKSRLTAAFADIIRKYRLERNLTQEALAEAARIHHTYVGLLERRKRIPTIEVAQRLAMALGTKLSSLIDEAERQK